jgi:hypothetical protein
MTEMKTPRQSAAGGHSNFTKSVRGGVGPKKDFFINPRPAPRLEIGQLWGPSMLVDLTFASHLDPSRKSDTSPLQLRAYCLEQAPVDFEEMRYW